MKNMNFMKMENVKNAIGKYLLYCYGASVLQQESSYQHEPVPTHVHMQSDTFV